MTMKKTDMTTKSRTELETQLTAAQNKLSQLRFDLADKKLKRTSDIRATKVEIARILTALRNATN
jgi:ribosomal protein L29